MLLEDIGEKRMMHSKSDKRETMTDFDTNEIIENFLIRFWKSIRKV